MSVNGIYSQSLGKGAPVVLVHGWGMHSGFWREFAQSLASRYQVISMDLPGHGRSSMVADFSLESLACSLLDEAPPKAHWVGWSLGGSVVLKLASLFPERVLSVSMIAGNPKFSKGSDWVHALEVQVLQQFHSNLRDDFTGTLLRFLKLQTQGMERGNLIYRAMKLVLTEVSQPDPAALAAGVEILINADLRDSVCSMFPPLLLLMGGRDPLVPAGAGREIARLNPTARLMIIEKAGHIPFVSHRAESLAAVRSFLEDVELS